MKDVTSSGVFIINPRTQPPMASIIIGGGSRHMSDTPKRFGSFEVLGLLGKGGMGEVYRARDTKLGREVALKFLPAEFSADRDRMARFEREARVLASLNHPNIAQIYGLEE